MIVIRRLVDRRRAYTGIFLKGEAPKIFPTSDREHARILEIFKQDRAHPGIENDFSDYALGLQSLSPAAAAWAKGARNAASRAPSEKIKPAAPEPRRDGNDPSVWITPQAVNR